MGPPKKVSKVVKTRAAPVVGDGDTYDWKTQVAKWNLFLREIGYLKPGQPDVGTSDEDWAYFFTYFLPTCHRCYMVDPADPKKPSTAANARLCPDDALHDHLLTFFKDVPEGPEIARRIAQVAASANPWNGPHFVPSDPPPISLSSITKLAQKYFVDIARHLLSVDFVANGAMEKDPIATISPQLKALLTRLAAIDLSAPLGETSKVFPKFRFVQETQDTSEARKAIHMKRMQGALAKFAQLTGGGDATPKEDEVADNKEATNADIDATLKFMTLGAANEDNDLWTAFGDVAETTGDDEGEFETVSTSDDDAGSDDEDDNATILEELKDLLCLIGYVKTPSANVLTHLHEGLYKMTCHVNLTSYVLWPWMSRYVHLKEKPSTATATATTTPIPCPYEAEWELYRHGVMKVDIKVDHVFLEMLPYGKIIDV